MKKTECPICGKLISNNNLEKHIKSHETHPKYQATLNSLYRLDHTDLFCKFCGKECKNANSLRNHERLCKQNPNRQESTFHAYNNSPDHIAWNKGLTKQTDTRVLKQSQTLKTSYKTGKAVNQGGFKRYSAQKCKYGTYKGFYCDSSWELAFLMYHLDAGIKIQRNTQAFDYIYDGKLHKYYPDFIVDEVFIEIKGRTTNQDKAKFEQFPIKDQLKLIDLSNINVYINYAVSTYGKDFAILYDREFPSWLDKLDTAENNLYNFKVNRV